MTNPVKVITPATAQPVDLDTAKEHLHANQDGNGDYLSDEDTTLNIYLAAAIRAVENKIQSNIMDSELEMYLTTWPGRCLSLDRYPVSAINSVKYYDENGSLQTVSASDYRLLDFLTPCVLEFDDDFDAPSLDDRLYPVVVNFNAGYQAPSGVTATIRHGVLLEFADRHELRMSEGTDMASAAAEALLSPESMWI